MNKLFVGVVGLGTVGKAVVKTLQDNKELIKSKAGLEIIPKIGVARRIDNKNLDIPLSMDINEILLDEEIGVVVELVGGVDSAYEIANLAFKHKKAFVTANKALLAYHRLELEARRDGLPLGFEASVCGAIPIITVIKEGLCADRILSIRGLMNGTSNYVLTQMKKEGTSLELALQQAKRLGYAEEDPKMDLNGSDSAHKLLILASIAYGVHARPEEILIEGIDGLEAMDLEFAKSLGREVKLLGIARLVGGKLEMRVGLAMLPSTSKLASVDGIMNAVSVVGERMGEGLHYGAGAGGFQTAGAVISDLIRIARGLKSRGRIECSHRAFSYDGGESLDLMPQGELVYPYYLRLVIARHANAKEILEFLEKQGLRIESSSQKEASGGCLMLVIAPCREDAFKAALKGLEKLEGLEAKPFFIRFEDE